MFLVNQDMRDDMDLKKVAERAKRTKAANAEVKENKK
jgi:hypothetical protein